MFKPPIGRLFVAKTLFLHQADMLLRQQKRPLTEPAILPDMLKAPLILPCNAQFTP